MDAESETGSEHLKIQVIIDIEVGKRLESAGRVELWRKIIREIVADKSAAWQVKNCKLQ